MSGNIPDYVNAYLAKHKDGKEWPQGGVVPSIICADDTTLSVQASRGHYCFPRSDTGPWANVEVWLVYSRLGRAIRVPSFGPLFGQNTTEPYPYVPVEKVNKFIHRHGGLKEA